MTYGIQSFQNASIKNIDPTMLGGRVFVKFIDQAYVQGTTIDIPIPNVSSHTHLRFYTLEPGSYSVSAFTNAGTATVRLTPYSHLQQFASNTVMLVFATQTVEPDYGILSVNNAGERLVSSIYPIPQFLERITFNTASYSSASYNAGRTISYHQSTTPVSLGAGRRKIALFTVPENLADCWYYMDSYVGTGNPYIEVSVETPNATPYALPEAYIFALDNPVPSSETYGLRIYGPSPSNTLLFDSGHNYMDIKGFENIYYYGLESSVTSSIFSNPVTAILIPGYFYEVAGQIGNTYSSWIYSYRGSVKKIGSTLYSKRTLVSRYYEDAAWSWTYEYGDSSNTIFAIDANIYGGTGSSGGGTSGTGMSAAIIVTAGTNTCSYNASTASTCSTSQTFVASVSGGNGNTISYSWSLVNAIGFSISGSTTTSTVTVINNGSSGSYTGTLQCVVTQSGSSDQIPTYPLSHTHTATVNPLSGSVSVSNQVSSCAYTSGTTCTTSATYTVGTISGGNGNPITYNWTLVNNTGGFTFTTGTTGTSIGITRTASAGTYAATVRCTVSQSGVSDLVIDTAVSHSHTAQTGSLVSPMVGTSNTTWTSTTITTDPGGAYAVCRIWMTNDGQIWIQENEGPRNGAPTSAWWSNATYNFGGGVAGIGTGYWVRFTRTAGDAGYSNATTGWLSLSQDRSVEVYSGVGDASSATRTATYTVEVASTSAGGAPISTTPGITIRAIATNNYSGGPIN